MIVKSALIGVITAATLTQAAVAGTTASKPAPSPAKQVTAKPAAAKPVVAPADEYFGRMKLSILGISNTIHDTKLREGFDPVHAAAYYDKLSLAEDALEDWSKKYPHDTWLPGKAYYMSHEFWAMNTPDGNREAERCRALLFAQFKTSPYAAKARTEAAAMFQPAIAAAQPAQAAVATGAAASAGATAATTTATTGTATSATVGATAAKPQTAATPHP
ncbi:MAG TPA: hypothetical protein VKT51_12510 [Candidatus Eremiobacteraceae bacterium]|nr:hypothetical protein [Candidatus Eremiobacteraceae bacterium]